MTTIKEVAELAGVSVATVSRTINNKGYVGKETRERVEKAIKTLEYYPNEVARSLFQKTSKMIGILLPDISNPYFPLLTKGIEDKAREMGYSIILGNVQDDKEKEKAYLKIFSQHNVAGILSAAEGTEVNDRGIPTVMLDRVLEENNYAVYTDDIKGGRLAAEAVADRNPRNIVVMAGPKNVPGSMDRLEGNLSLLNEKGLHYRIYQTKSFYIEEAEKTAKHFFQTFDSVDSVIASNDIFALAIMKEGLRMGCRIPEDLQIIGYDDIPFSRLVYPGLTTISQPAHEIGYKGAELLFDIIQNKRIESKRIKLEPTLIIRDSLREREED